MTEDARQKEHARMLRAFLLIEEWAERALVAHDADPNIGRIFRLAHAIRAPSCMHKHPTWLADLDTAGPDA